MVVDTDIFIWTFKNKPKAAHFLTSLDDIYISDVTYMELIQGSFNKQEAAAIERSLDQFAVTRLAISESISKCACDLVKQFALSHSMQLADALIASTALEYDLPLASANIKHFSFIEGLEFTPFRIDD